MQRNLQSANRSYPETQTQSGVVFHVYNIAKVRLIEPSAFTKVSSLGVEEQRVNAIGDFVDAHRLGDAYRVDVQIVIWQGKDVLQVPLSALFRCERTNWCTFVVKEGKVDQQQVSIGQRSDLAA
jgi:HlyD family secretion protein